MPAHCPASAPVSVAGPSWPPPRIRELDLLTRLAAGTAGVVGAEFLRRLVAELAGALGAEVAFVAELCEQGPATRARSRASAGIELREGYEFALAGTPCEDAYCTSCCSSAAAPARAIRKTRSSPPTSSTATSRSRCTTRAARRSATSA